MKNRHDRHIVRGIRSDKNGNAIIYHGGLREHAVVADDTQYIGGGSAERFVQEERILRFPPGTNIKHTNLYRCWEGYRPLVRASVEDRDTDC